MKYLFLAYLEAWQFLSSFLLDVLQGHSLSHVVEMQPNSHNGLFHDSALLYVDEDLRSTQCRRLRQGEVHRHAEQIFWDKLGDPVSLYGIVVPSRKRTRI
ncbi:hypothetical protein BDV33DRAFT_12630 [Aspergillus novoparasiticus]|uniref:Uncharacterized protein n=1 Tax=Aspergillus novoparasiticus TaxID=986946 RepID=A0A5N6F2Y3_9EURO|nr:hypothetical protein BDV33DRAFT_12630 [Aspergillus novoparasiticus]